MTVNARSTVSSTRALLDWAATAPAGETVTYHVGALSVDRANSRDLARMADTVMILQSTGWLLATQTQMRFAVGPLAAYHATRTGRGHAPHGLVKGTITASEWLALFAVKDKAATTSAQRAIRDHVQCGEDMASLLLHNLVGRGLLARDDGKQGYVPTEVGAKMLT